MLNLYDIAKAELKNYIDILTKYNYTLLCNNEYTAILYDSKHNLYQILVAESDKTIDKYLYTEFDRAWNFFISNLSITWAQFWQDRYQESYPDATFERRWYEDIDHHVLIENEIFHYTENHAVPFDLFVKVNGPKVEICEPFTSESENYRAKEFLLSGDELLYYNTSLDRIYPIPDTEKLEWINHVNEDLKEFYN